MGAASAAAQKRHLLTPWRVSALANRISAKSTAKGWEESKAGA